MAEEISQELAQRMAKLLREQVERLAGAGFVTDAVEEARAIVALLPEPVDPLLEEAREIAAEVWEESGIATVASEIRAGNDDGDHAVQSALIALRRREERDNG